MRAAPSTTSWRIWSSGTPGFKSQVITDEGQLHRFVNIYINDEDIRYLGQLDTPVKDGDVVSILPALAGGGTSCTVTIGR